MLDLTIFLNQHPGGRQILLLSACGNFLLKAGKDGTASFRRQGHSQVAVEMRQAYVIGKLDEPKPCGKDWADCPE